VYSVLSQYGVTLQCFVALPFPRSLWCCMQFVID